MAMTVSTCQEMAESGNLYPRLNSCGRYISQKKAQVFLVLTLTGAAAGSSSGNNDQKKENARSGDRALVLT